MLSLREKHEYEQEIADLKVMLITMSAEHEKKIKKLKVTVRSLQVNRSMWRVRYQKLNSSRYPKQESRTEKARVAVQAWIDGDKLLSFKEIADKFFLSYATIKRISHDLQKLKAIDV